MHNPAKTDCPRNTGDACCTCGHYAWQLAARRMVADACEAERLRVRGTRKTHVPYTVPDWCRPLLDAVEQDDEVETKRIMHVVRAGAFTLV